MKIDYEKIGFKSGLEIHQQLDSHKLFCNCPSILRTDEPSFIVKRKLHAIAGESGEIDVATKHEAHLDKEFIYQAYDTTCLIELDEEPPHQINSEALKIALQIALLLNAKIFPITQIMRKTVIDGSNTSGFQRTAQIAYDGYVETSQGKVRIDGIFLEEDSARPTSGKEEDDEKNLSNLQINDSGNSIQRRGGLGIERSETPTRSGNLTNHEFKNVKIYKLDRLGIPLVEIATAPDIKNAEHAKETTILIGNILRSVKVRRGIGTIRQDINISIKGSNRVELKGFQNPKIMIKTVENEIERQLEVLEKIKLMRGDKFVKKVNDNNNKEISRGKQRGYFQTNVIGNSVRARAGFGVERSETPTRSGNPENPREISANYRANLEKEAMPQVRNVLPDGTSEFMRPMPGSARMYPETDLPLLKISREITNDIKKDLPKTKKDIEIELEKKGLNHDMIKILFKQNKVEEFKELLDIINNPQLIAKILLMFPKEIAKREDKSLEEVEEKLEDIYSNILEGLKEKKITESDIKNVMTRLVQGIEFEKAIIFEKENIENLEEKIRKILKEKPGLNTNAYMGLVMKEFGGKISGAEAMKVIQKITK